MRIGVTAGTSRSLDELVARARELESRGFATMWLPHVFGHDAVTAAAVVGRETSRIELGTAVVPTYPRHPSALAQQALSASAACAGRFTLGIGLSHPVVIEDVLGLSYARRASHMREYMAVLGPLLGGERVEFDGDEYRVKLKIGAPDARPVPVLLAALGDKMLEIAGRCATGTVLWMTGPRTIESHIAPKLRAAAREAGRPDPRIVAGTFVALTSDPASVTEGLAKQLATYSRLPSYKAMLDKEGAAAPTELVLAGDEQALDAGLQRLRDVGVSDLEAVVVASHDANEERTLEYLQSRL